MEGGWGCRGRPGLPRVAGVALVLGLLGCGAGVWVS